MLAEIQQHSDATFRLFDYGRRRELHEDSAVAVSDAGPVQAQPGPRRLTAARTVLIASQHFILERIDLSANSNWALNTDQETWILVIEGSGRIALTDTTVGNAVFIEADRTGIEVGPDGLSGLVAYPGPDPIASLLQDGGARTAVHSPKSNEIVEVQT